jgi:hypothetical protein
MTVAYDKIIKMVDKIKKIELLWHATESKK